jgi:hypothetical protein
MRSLFGSTWPSHFTHSLWSLWLGCCFSCAPAAPPGEARVFRRATNNTELLVTRKDRFPDTGSLLFRITHEGRLIAGPRFFRADRADEKFDAVLLDGGELIAVYEVSRPDQIVIAFDAVAMEWWPSHLQDEEVERRLRDKITKRLGREVTLTED